MKFRVKCKSLLLQKTLEQFLKDYLDEDGKIVSDYEGDFVIGRDIVKPFSKSQLLLQLEDLIKIEETNKSKTIDKKVLKELDLDIKTKNLTFEVKLDKLIDEFSQKLKKLIKEEYGKK